MRDLLTTNELRIGNTVLLGEEPYVIDKGEDLDWLIFKGIPISEGWLYKLGFGSHNYFKGEWICKYINSEDGTGLFYNTKDRVMYNGIDALPHIKYIHQIENLYLDLTGTEII